MARIIKIIPVHSDKIVHSVDRDKVVRYDTIDILASIVVLDTQDRYEAQTFSETLQTVFEKYQEKFDFAPHPVIQPPVKSFSHGNHFIIRVDGVNDLEGFLKVAIREAKAGQKTMHVLSPPAVDDAAALDEMLKKAIEIAANSERAKTSTLSVSATDKNGANGAPTVVAAWRAAISAPVPARPRPAFDPVAKRAEESAKPVVGAAERPSAKKQKIKADAPPVGALAVKSEVADTVVAVKPSEPRQIYVPPEGKKSFIEIIDESYKAGHTFRIFLNNILHEWGDAGRPMPLMEFDRLVREKSSKPYAKPHLGFRSDRWLMVSRGMRPSGNILDNMISAMIVAFVPDDDPPLEAPHLRYRHALKLCRLVNGQPIDTAKTRQLIEMAQKDKEHQALFAALYQWSGINTFGKLTEWSGIPRANIQSFLQGAHVRSRQDRVPGLMSLLNPPTLEAGAKKNPKIVAQNKILAEIATGRPLSLTFDDMADRARESDNPRNELFNMLVGPRGKVKMNDEELASYVTEKLKRRYSPGMILERRLGNTQMIESEAKVLAELAGYRKKDEVETCVEILTGIPAPGKLLDMVEASLDRSFSIGRMFQLSRIRKGRSQYGWDLEQAQISFLETNPDYKLRKSSAIKLADGLKLVDGDRRRFILLSMGRSVLNAQELTLQAIDDPSQRPKALRTLFKGMDCALATLADRMNTYPHLVELWMENGRITSRNPSHVAHVVADGMLIDQPESRQRFEADFQKAFASPKP